MNARVLWKGLELLNVHGDRFETNQLLFEDDTALVVDSEDKFCRLVGEFRRVCERIKLSYEVLEVWKWESNVCNTKSEPLEEVDSFKYLGSQVAADEGCERDVLHRMNDGNKACEALKSVLSNRGLGIKAKKCLYEGVIVPTAFYGAEAWGMRSAERSKVNVLEMKCLRSFVGVSRNLEVRRGKGIEMELASRADQRVLRWLGHVKRMEEYRMARRVLMTEVSGARVRDRPRLGWMDGVKVTLSNREITVDSARQCYRKIEKSGEPWCICN